MSHANGAVKFKSDNLIMFFEYNGTTDVSIPFLYDTKKELYDNWRKGKWGKCECGKDEEVELMNDYGGGATQQGRACRYCKAIVFPIGCDEMLGTEADGLPDWNPFK